MSLTCKPKKRMKRWIKFSYITRIKITYKRSYSVLPDPINNQRTLTSISTALVLLFLRGGVYEEPIFAFSFLLSKTFKKLQTFTKTNLQFYQKQHFYKQHRLKLAKNRAKAKQHPGAELLLFENY